MTKYEWESELRKNIHRLPEDEIRRVFEYYTELFEDKIERGADERNIIMEFGNPVDVADKILAEYYGINHNIEVAPKVSEDYKVKGGGKWKESKPEATSDADYFEEKPQVEKCRKNCSKMGKDKRKSNFKPETSVWRIVLFITLAIVFGGFYIGLVVAMWAIVVGLFVAGIACIISGLVYIVPTIMIWSSGVYPAMVQLSVCLLIVGAGFLITFSVKIFSKVSKFVTVKVGGIFKSVLVTRRGGL